MRFGWGVSGSRRRQAQEQELAVCKGMRFATLLCQCAKSTLFAPAGQRRFRVARLILELSRERAESREPCPSGTVGRRAGERGRGRDVLQFFVPAKASVPTLPQLPASPAILRGERRTLPAPAQGIYLLRIPFWETDLRFPAVPTPSISPQAADPCSWACHGLFPLPPQSERNAAHPPHARGVGVRRIRAKGTGRRRCRPEQGTCMVNRP